MIPLLVIGILEQFYLIETKYIEIAVPRQPAARGLLLARHRLHPLGLGQRMLLLRKQRSAALRASSARSRARRTISPHY